MSDFDVLFSAAVPVFNKVFGDEVTYTTQSGQVISGIKATKTDNVEVFGEDLQTTYLATTFEFEKKYLGKVSRGDRIDTKDGVFYVERKIGEDALFVTVIVK